MPGWGVGLITSTSLQLSMGVSEEATDIISQDRPIKWEMLWLDSVVLKWHHTQHVLALPPGNTTCYSSHAGPGKESRVKERPQDKERGWLAACPAMLPCAGILGGSPPAAGPVLSSQKRDIFSAVLSLQRHHGQSSCHCVQPDHVMSHAPLSLTSVVLHMDVVNVLAVLLLHGVGHPAAL